MLYISTEGLIRRRIEVVWEILTDVGGAVAWVDGLVEAKTENETLGRGTELTLKRRTPRGPTVRAESVITIWTPPSVLVIETRTPDLLLLDRVTLTPLSEGTTVQFNAELIYGNRLVELLTRRTGLLLGSLMPHPVDDMYDRSMQAFVKRVETIAAAPYR